jgi:hypothetical protein
MSNSLNLILLHITSEVTKILFVTIAGYLPTGSIYENVCRPIHYSTYLVVPEGNSEFNDGQERKAE